MSDKPERKIKTRLEESSTGVILRERYGFVLLLILIGYLLTGVEASKFISAVNTVLWVAMLLVTLWAPGVPTRVRRIGVIATAVLLVTSVSLGLVSSDAAEGWRFMLLALAQLAAMIAIVSRIVQHEEVGLQTVMGGVAAYALIAFFMGAIYSGADLLTAEPFLNGIVDPGDYTYFSFVTLTTVGFGDITAATDLAKRLVVIEAFVGQVFIIVFVARLVSLWGHPIRGGRT
ncbi:MAG TPA: potassium channel family protein [Acidimicrobiia bacterium]